MVDFAVLEDRLNAAALAKLANCTATVGGGAAISGIFDAAYLDALGMSGSKPSLSCASADVSTAAQGTAVVVTYKAVVTNYTVCGIQPDGTGMTRLLLQES